MQEAWSVLRLLKWTSEYFKEHGVESPRREAEDLLGHVLDLDRLKLYLAYESQPSPSELKIFRDLVARRAKGEPLQYLLGWQPFLNLKIKVDRRALIPRPETEHLAGMAIEKLRTLEAPFLADLGTGTGCLALGILKALPLARAWASEKSSEALSLASENAQSLGLAERLQLQAGDFFDSMPSALDLVVSNPPYIAVGESLPREVAAFEPEAALYSGPEGLDALRRILARAPDFMKPGAWLLLECGLGQPERLLQEAGAAWTEPKIEKDQYDMPRFFVARKKD